MVRNPISRFNLRRIAIMALVLTFTPALNVASLEVATAQGGDELLVRNALMKNAASFERNDLAALKQVWANDELVTVFEDGHANYGWADYRDHHLVPEMAELKNTKYVLTDIKPRIAGSTAWATFKYTISVDYKERHVDGGGLGTAVLEKRDGRWQIVHWHSSSPRRAPSTQSPPKKGNL